MMTRPIDRITSSAPAKIYLDLPEDAGFDPETVFKDFVEVTWSEDCATGVGIPYIRADMCTLIRLSTEPGTAPATPPAASGAAPALPTDAMIHAAAHAYDVSQATPLVKMRCAISAALARQEAAQPADDGYATAFYEIASVLGIGARADTPENVFRNEMLPKIAALASREASDVMVDMVPPATARDRWMYEQGRLAERDPRTHQTAALASPQVAPDPHNASQSFEMYQLVVRQNSSLLKQIEALEDQLAAIAAPVQVAPASSLLPTDAMIHAAVNAYETSQATPMVKMRCALSAALARQSAPMQPGAAADDARDAARLHRLQAAIDAMSASTPAAKPAQPTQGEQSHD